MRLAFIQTLTKLVRKDKRIMLLTGDLGFNVLEEFAQEFPDQFLNCGVAEANMVGVAAGLAHEGFIPFVYSIAPFVTLRVLEQIRNDVCFHNLPVKIVGIGGGLAYGHAGSSHHTLEDVAVLRSIANMTIIVPADREETRSATQAIAHHPGPVYLRLAKESEESVYTKNRHFRLGKGIETVPGVDVALITCGSIVAVAAKARSLLVQKNLSVSVVNIHTLKPLDVRLIKALTKKYRILITLEEHSTIGGLGSAVADIVAKTPLAHFYILGLEDCYVTHVGSQQHLQHIHGLSTEKIAKRIIQLTLSSRALRQSFPRLSRRTQGKLSQ